MLGELHVFPSRDRKLPSLAYSREELGQQLKEQARLNRYLRKAHSFEFESIPHEVFDVLKTDLTQPTLQKKTDKTLSLFSVPPISIEREQANVVNEPLTFELDEYRAKRRRLLEPLSPSSKPQEQVQSSGNVAVVQPYPQPQQQQQQQQLQSQPQTAPIVESQQRPVTTTITKPAATTTAASTKSTTETTDTMDTTLIDATNSDIDTWYAPTDLVSSPTFTFPVCWVPLFPNQQQIAYCKEQSNINSRSPSQYILAFDRMLEYLNYPLNGEVSIEEETLDEHWNSSEKLKLLKGVMDKLADQDICVAVLTPDNDGEGVLNDLLENAGYECSRLCNVITDDSESDDEIMYGVVFYTNKNKMGVVFDNGVDVAFIMDPRIVRDNTKKNITMLRARHDKTLFATFCYLVTMGSVEERALKGILRNSTARSLTEHQVMNAIIAQGEWPLDPGNANKSVLNNLLSWLESKSKLDYTYRSKRELPGSTRIEPVVVEEQPPAQPATTTTTTTTTTTEQEGVDVITTPSPAVDTTTTTIPANDNVSDMDVSSGEEETEKTLSDYIKTHIDKIFPDFTVNKTQLTNGEQAQTSITELDRKVVDNLNEGLLQEYLKSANEAQERFEKEIKGLKENYKKLALTKTMEMYH